MSSFSINMNPSFLLPLQLTTSILTLGFTTPSSIFRFAALPIQLALWYLTFQTSSEYMRVAWSQIYNVSCFILFVMNFLEMSLLRKWSFEANGPTLHPPSAKPLPPTHSNGKSSTKVGSKVQDTILNRLKFGLNCTFSLRDLNTPHKQRAVPPFSTTNPAYIPSKSTFLLSTALRFAIAYLFFDLAESLPHPPSTAPFSPSKVPVFTRLREMTGEEVATRISTSAMVWMVTGCLISCYLGFQSFILVGTNLTPVSSWRPLFGSFSNSYTLRGFWGKSWHQLLRKPLNNPAIWFVENGLGLKKGLVARYLKIFVTFFLSGLIHLLPDLTAGITFSQSGALRFYCVQVLGIILEDGVQEIYRRAGGKEGKVWTKAGGFIWVAAFLLFWSSPSWHWPQVYRAGTRTGGR